MAFPIDVKVKEENKWENEDLHDVVDFDIAIKIENQHDWCIESLERDGNNNENGYQELIRLHEHQCRRCGISFNNRYTLLQHNLKHFRVPLNQIYECDDCHTFFTTKHNLIHHRNIQHVTNISNSLKKCEICHKVYSYKNWHFHMSTVHTNEALPCEICHKKFKCKQYLNRHIRKRHTEDAQTCLKTYARKQHWVRQMRKKLIKVSKNNWSCKQCDTVLNSKNALTTHIRNCHSESVTCQICGSKMKSKAYLLGHLRRIHNNKGHVCPVCGKKIRSPTYLKLHLKNHEEKNIGRVMSTRSGLGLTQSVLDEKNGVVIIIHKQEAKCENQLKDID